MNYLCLINRQYLGQWWNNDVTNYTYKLKLNCLKWIIVEQRWSTFAQGTTHHCFLSCIKSLIAGLVRRGRDCKRVRKEERLVLGVFSGNKVEHLIGSCRMPWILWIMRASVHYCSHNAYFITLKVRDKGLMSQMSCNCANTQSHLTISIPSIAHLPFKDQIRRHEICVIYIAFPEKFSDLYKHDLYWYMYVLPYEPSR